MNPPNSINIGCVLEGRGKCTLVLHNEFYSHMNECRMWTGGKGKNLISYESKLWVYYVEKGSCDEFSKGQIMEDVT